MLGLDGHQVHPLGNGAVGRHLFRGDHHTFRRRVCSAGKAIDQGLGDTGPGHHTVDELGVAGRLEQKHPGQHRQPEWGGDLLHKTAQAGGVHHHLGLEEAGSGLLFAPDPGAQSAPAGGLGIGGGAGEERRGPIRQLPLHRILAGIEGPHELQQPHRFQFIHRPDPRLIPGPHRVTGEAEQVADAEGVGAEQVGLEGDAIAVAAGHLQHGLNAGLQQQAAHRQAAHPHHRPATVGDIDRLHQAPQRRRGLKGATGVTASGRSHFRRDGEAAVRQGLSKLQRPSP